MLFLIILLNIFLVKSEHYDKNLTDFSRCKIHYSRSESSYTNFYQITNNFRENSSLEFDFHFSVLAPSDAHILIAPSNKLNRQDPVYEIVLGAGSNTFSDIRRLQKASVQRSIRTKNILSRLDIRSFWLHISKDGLIQVGRETEELPFLSWKDPDPLPVQVFSFNTWPGIEAKWFYDCQRYGNESSSEEIEESLTDIMRLKKQILYKYDPYTRPILNENDLTVIYINFIFERISLDEKESKMSIQGTMDFKWKDEKIFWNSSEFGGIEKIHMFYREIWQPNLVIFNAASGTGSNFLKSTFIEVDQFGKVYWKTFVDNLDVWCDTSGIGSGNWPKDQHTCEVQFGFLAEQNKFLFQTTLESKLISSEWNVLDVSSEPIADSKDIDNSILGTCSIKFKLQRYSAIYTAIYYAPLITVSITMLITFCLSTNGPARIGLNCLQLLLLCLFMVYLSVRIPSTSSTVPYIVLLYSNGVIASVISLAVNIYVINITRVKRTEPIPQILSKIITSYYFKTFILSFGFLKSSDSYDNLIGDNSSSTSMEANETWKLLGRTIDTIMFVIYSILIAVYLFQNY